MIKNETLQKLQSDLKEIFFIEIKNKKNTKLQKKSI